LELIIKFDGCVQNPEVLEFKPSSGPKAGGTRVTFQGRSLNTGANIRVLFDSVPCHVQGLVFVSHMLTTVTARMIIRMAGHDMPLCYRFYRLQQFTFMWCKWRSAGLLL